MLEVTNTHWNHVKYMPTLPKAILKHAKVGSRSHLNSHNDYTSNMSTTITLIIIYF